MGSFEVTKTDADLTQKRSSPTIQTSTLRPFTITNGGGMKIKTKKITIEKVKIPSKGMQETTTIVNRARIESVTEEMKAKKTKVVTTTVPPTTITTTTTTTTKTTTTKQPSTTTKRIETTTSVTEANVTTLIPEEIIPTNRFNISNVHEPAKLDEHLFTVAPILDKEPWHPINPTVSVTTFKPSRYPTRDQQLLVADDKKKPLSYEQVQPRNKPHFTEALPEIPNQSLVYHSFSNPAFTFAPPGIERLGTADVRPYPIPVNKISDENVPDFKYVASDIYDDQIPMNNGKYEHLGGGIIVKKSEPTEEVTTSLPLVVVNTQSEVEANTDTIFTEASARIGDLLLELLEIERDQQANTTIMPTSTEKTFNFNNIKDYVLSAAKNQTIGHNDTILLLSSTQRTFPKTPTIAPTMPTAASYVEVETVQYTPPATATWDQQSLFPSPSKSEFSLNGTAITPAEKQMIRRIFNETLQAWIVENSQKQADPTGSSPIDLQHKRNTSQHLQNISAIFDTLASKLGMSSGVGVRLTPFKSLIGSKAKKNRTVVTVVASASKPITIDTSSRLNDKAMTEQPPVESTQPIPVLLITTTTVASEVFPPSSSAAESVIVGEAEIEEVDPTQYEQMLKQDSHRLRPTPGPTPALITLMPVKSNSGLRFNRPGMVSNNARGYGSNQTPPPASVIRTQLNVNE